MNRFMRAVNPHTLINIAKALIALALLIWLVHSGRLDFAVLLSAPLNIFHLLGILTLSAHVLLQVVRWWWLLRTQRINLSLGQALQLSWIGQFFSSLLPGAAGGDLVRAYYVARDASAAKVAGVSTVLLDRALGLYALLWLGVPSVAVLIILQDELTSAVIQMGALISLLVIGTTVLFLALWARPTRSLILGLVPGRFRTTLEATLVAYHDHGRDLIFCFVLSLLASIMLMGTFLLLGRAIGTPLGWQQVFLAGPLVIVANSLPVSPGGLGVAETAASVLFAGFGVDTGAEIMLILRFWVVVLGLPGGLMYVLRTRRSAFTQPVEEARPRSRLTDKLRR